MNQVATTDIQCRSLHGIVVNFIAVQKFLNALVRHSCLEMTPLRKGTERRVLRVYFNDTVDDAWKDHQWKSKQVEESQCHEGFFSGENILLG